MAAGAWLQLLIFIFLCGVLFHLPWLVYFSVSVSLVMAIAHYWRKHALDGIRYTRRFRYTRGFPGEKSEVQLTVVNDKLLPVSWLRVSDTWPTQAGPVDDNLISPSHLPGQGMLVNLYSLRWRERITRAFPLLFRKRGIYETGPIFLEAGDLFGLYEQGQERAQTNLLVVFPEILPFAQLKLPAADPFGDRRARRPIFEDPIQTMGIRPYTPEDGFRRIHWPASARSGSLQVKVYQPVTTRVLAICLDVSTQEHYWLGYNPEILEQMVKICATLVNQGIQEGYSVGLFANGCLAHSDQPFRILPGRSPDQLALLLQALAGVTPYVTTRFEDFLLRSLPHIPFGSTLLLVTANLAVSLQDTLLRLRRYRQPITLLTLQELPPPDLPGIRVVHLPFAAPDSGVAP